MRRPAPLAEAVGKGRGLSAAGLAFVLLGAVLAAVARPSSSTAEVSFGSGAEAEIVVSYEMGEDGTISEEKVSLMTARYSQAGPVMQIHGDMQQFHPLAYCQPDDDHKSGYVAVIKLEQLDSDQPECSPVLTKARKAIARGAEAVIFDVSNNSNAVEKLSVETLRPLTRPVLYIQGEDARQLLHIILHRARARVLISPKETVYGGVDIIVFVSLFAIVLIVCLLFYLKMKLSQRRSHTELTRLTLLAMESMETRKYRAKGRRCTRKLNRSRAGSLSSGSECAICLEHYTDGEEVRVVSCRHKFHRRCVDPWLLRQRSCPRCRYTILDLSRIAIPRPAAPSLVFSPPHQPLVSTVTSPPTIAGSRPPTRRPFYPPAPHMFLSHRQGIRPYDRHWNTTGSRRLRGSFARTRLPRRCRCFCPQCRGDGILGNRRLRTQLSSPLHDTDVSPLSSPASTSSGHSLSSSDTGDASRQGVYGSGSTRRSSPGSDCEAFVFRGHKPANGPTLAVLPQLCSVCQSTAPSIEHPLLPAAVTMTAQATPHCIHHHHQDAGHIENGHHNDGGIRERSHHYGTMLRDWPNTACNNSHNCGFENKLCWECNRHQQHRVFHSSSQTENSIFDQWEICLDARAESSSCQGEISLRDVRRLTQDQRSNCFHGGTSDLEGCVRHVRGVEGGARHGHVEECSKHVEGGARQVEDCARHVGHVEGGAMQVEDSARHVGYVERCVGHVERDTARARHVGNAAGDARHEGDFAGGVSHVWDVSHTGGARHAGEVTQGASVLWAVRHAGGIEGGTRDTGEVERRVRNIEGSAGSMRHAGDLAGDSVRHAGDDLVGDGVRHVGDSVRNDIVGDSVRNDLAGDSVRHAGDDLAGDSVRHAGDSVRHAGDGVRHAGDHLAGNRVKHVRDSVGHAGDLVGSVRCAGDIDGLARRMRYDERVARHAVFVEGANQTKSALEEDVWVPLEIPLLLQAPRFPPSICEHYV
uniref:E3 ubiquitin-protein ligase znrf3-like isoform X2 n=1 Tax=Myxine glutinosa TaxID=7769 RepID=UPI00358F2758